MDSKDRLKRTIHYICRQCGSDPTRLRKVKLHKIIYLSDMWRFKVKTRSITGASFLKYPFGPFVREVDEILEELSKEGKVTIIPRDEQDEYDPVGLVGKGQPDMQGFDDRELSIIDEQIEYVCDHTANAISEKTHGPVWQMAEMGEEMPLEAQIAVNLTNTTEEDMEFAASLK